MFGHVDAPPHWVAHLRRIARIQADTGGFTEFVPLPFVHRNAPIYLAGKARAGATFEENLQMHAVARILLDGLIPNIQEPTYTLERTMKIGPNIWQIGTEDQKYFEANYQEELTRYVMQAIDYSMLFGEGMTLGSGPFGTTYFTLTGFQLGTVGDAGPGICEGPSLFQVDLSLYKNIKISKTFLKS